MGNNDTEPLTMFPEPKPDVSELPWELQQPPIIKEHEPIPPSQKMVCYACGKRLGERNDNKHHWEISICSLCHKKRPVIDPLAYERIK